MEKILNFYFDPDIESAYTVYVYNSIITSISPSHHPPIPPSPHLPNKYSTEHDISPVAVSGAGLREVVSLPFKTGGNGTPYPIDQE